MNLGLAGKRAIVTGASRGIGEAIGRQLVEAGAAVLLVARGRRRLDEARRRFERHDAVHIYAADVAAEGIGEAVAAAALDAMGGIDILIANAGGGGGDPQLARSTALDWQSAYRLNVVHAVDLLRACVPHMQGGSALFITSISGRLPVTERAHYAAAKAALGHAARCLALELAPVRIRVNALAPGSIMAAGGLWQVRQGESPDRFRKFVGEHPWQRLGTPEQVARVATFLVSPAADWVNGTEVAVDGGQRIPSWT